MNGHTPGPWRWELNQRTKILHLVGGRPQYDLTVMDFDRWGMNGATISLRDIAHDGMNLMSKLHERPDWIAPFPGRAHHASWCMAVIHPDARLMAAAPCLLQALQESIEDSEEVLAVRIANYGESYRAERLKAMHDQIAKGRAVIAQATGEPI